VVLATVWKKNMLNRLRWKLTAFYILAAACLVLLIGAGSYALLRYYYQYETDQALEYKMSLLFDLYGFKLPQQLVKAQQSWPGSSTRSVGFNLPATIPPSRSDVSHEEDEIAEHRESELNGWERAEAYDGSLAPIFILPQASDVSATGTNPITGVPAPILSDKDAASAAMVNGSDLRTLQLSDGSNIRLLSYRIDGGGSSASVLQIGRLLTDQDRILQQYLTGLLVLGAISILIMGAGSWWLSGRSIRPAQTAWDLQQTFVSNASHELRTPLTFIRATAEYGLRQKPTADQAEILSEILNEEDYMNRLVDDLLLLSRLDTHRLILERKKIPLHELIAEIQHQVEKVASQNGVEIMVGNTDGQVIGDPTRLRQILLILLDNSLRFTPAGGSIHIDTAAQGKFRSVRIQDNGAGIPDEDLPHIFDRFYQVHSLQSDNQRNNGLGLNIAKSLVEAMGGNIALSSQEGKGTAVNIWLPASNEFDT
jgi:signal transduction histidine kinase